MIGRGDQKSGDVRPPGKILGGYQRIDTWFKQPQYLY